MKKRLYGILVFLLLVFLVSGCNNSNSTNSIKNPSNMSRGEIVFELNSINNDLTDLWNEVFCEVEHYSEDGLSATGGTLDIDFVIENMDKYYNKVKKNNEFIDQLDDEYSDIKNAYNKMFDKATIIYNELKKETPKPNTKLKYQSDMDLFKQYQDYLWNTIVDME